jgi:hypothetical protein
MQGEMGGTVFSYPQGYISIAKDIRKRYTGKATLKVGALFNHAYLYGHINRFPDVQVSRAPLWVVCYHRAGATGKHSGAWIPVEEGVVLTAKAVAGVMALH